jgi:prepilin-type N-terminal cleavage/methylation domain-containing protein
MRLSIFKHLSSSAGGNKPSGFTLIEILIAVCIIGFGCLAVITMNIMTNKTRNTSDNITKSTLIATTEIEKLKSLSFDELKNISDYTDANINSLGEKCDADSGCRDYIFTRKVRVFSKTPTSLSYHIEVEVEWRDSSGPHAVLQNTVLTSLALS